MATKSSKSAECVKVVIRCRPLSSNEIKQNFQKIVKMDTKKGLVEVTPPTSGEMPKSFTFDSVYDGDSKQKDLYDETFAGLVQSAIDGFNGTIFAYGQTGTGKTFTMQGVKEDPVLKGVIPNSFEQIFNHIATSTNQQYLVRASYLEIYQEEIRDLLTKDQSRRLELKERPDTGVYVKDLSSFVCKNIDEIDRVMDSGNLNRSVGATNMNEHSSRSHAIFLVTIECSEVGIDGEDHIRVGKLNMVDLAGSERQAKTGATGDRLKEATKINLSLSALGNVISALVDGKSSHIPYRDSKLTRLLQDSLGGNAKTVMVANVGPANYNYDETVTTLRYANRAKNIKNRPKINEDPKDALLREFQDEIARLKAHLEAKGGGGKKRLRSMSGGAGGGGDDDDDDEEDEDPEKAEAEFRKEQQENLEREKQAIMNDTSMLSEQKQQLLSALETKRSRLQQEQEQAAALSAKIKAMESKLLIGGAKDADDVQNRTVEQKRALAERQRQIAMENQKKREIEQKLMQQEESAHELQETYTSLQQEVEAKTKKLRKLFAKLTQTRQEIEDMRSAHEQERGELDETYTLLMRELKLKSLIIRNFIAESDKKRLETRMIYDEESESFSLKPIESSDEATHLKRPISAQPGAKRATCEYTRMAAGISVDTRYRHENIILLELDIPARTTRDYEAPQVAPHVQAALDAALKDEGDLSIDSNGPAGNIFTSLAAATSKKSGSKRAEPDFEKSTKPKSGRPRTTKKFANAPDEELFPTSKGLVPK